MDKFTFRLPDRLKLTVEKRSERVNVLVFSKKVDSTFKLNKEMTKQLLSCKTTFSGVVKLNPPLEHPVTMGTYSLSFVDCDTDGVLVTLTKKKVSKTKNIHKFYMSKRDFKKFCKVVKEVFKYE